MLIFEWKPEGVISHIYDGLLGFDPGGQVVPRLASGWRWVTPTRLRLTLRRGVRFHDGEAFDAETVRWNFETMRAMGLRCTRQFLFQHLVAVEVQDRWTVDLVTAHPDGVMTHRLAAFSWMLPRGAEARGMEAEGRAPVGTGPYRFVGWTPEGHLDLDAVEDHWSGPPPHRDGLRWFFLPQPEQVQRLLDGRLDLLGEVDPYYHTRIQRSAVAQVVPARTLVQVNLVFNTLSGAAADLRVRRAIRLAVHTEDLLRYVARGNGRAVAGTSMKGQACHPVSPRLRPFDPAEARRLIREVTGGERLRLEGLLDPDFLILGRGIQAQLRKIGVDLELVEASRDQLFREVVAPRATGTFSWGRDFFLSSVPDPMHHYYFINSLALTSQGPWSLWRNPVYDALFQDMVEATDPVHQRALCAGLDEVVAEHAPLVVLYQVLKTYAVRQGLGYQPTSSGLINLRTAPGGHPAALSTPEPLPEETP